MVLTSSSALREAREEKNEKNAPVSPKQSKSPPEVARCACDILEDCGR